MADVDKKVNEIHQDIQSIPFVKDFCENTGIPPGALGFVLITGAVWYVIANFQYSQLAIQIVGTVYPCYKTILALQTENTIEDDQQWLTYWMVFGIFSTIDCFAGFIL